MNTLSDTQTTVVDPPVGVILGGSGGIGSAVAKMLMSQGWKVILVARHQEGLDATLQGLQGIGTQPACSLVVDVCKSQQVDQLFARLLEDHAHVDGVVNCVGSILLKSAHTISDEEFEEALAVNLKTAFYLVRAAVRVMMKQSNGGSIVLCSSVAAQRGLINHEAIAAAKAGIEGLMRAAAATYAKYHIRLNAVAPGLVRTPLTRKLTENENVAKISAAMHPLGRIGEPSDVASAIAWLLDPHHSWITGQVLGIDGGLGNLQAR